MGQHFWRRFTGTELKGSNNCPPAVLKSHSKAQVLFCMAEGRRMPSYTKKSVCIALLKLCGTSIVTHPKFLKVPLDCLCQLCQMEMAVITSNLLPSVNVLKVPSVSSAW